MPGATGPYRGLTLDEFTSALASAEPVPGGGSAAAVAGSLAAALLAMVGNLSLGRPRYAPYERTVHRALEAGLRGRERMLELADQDAAAFERFGAARRMPRDTAEQQSARDEATRAAARAAAEVPLTVVRECGRLVDEVEALAGRSNLNAASDLEVAALLLLAAARGAAANVTINVPAISDEAFTGVILVQMNGHLREIERSTERIRELVAGRTLRDPEAA